MLLTLLSTSALAAWTVDGGAIIPNASGIDNGLAIGSSSKANGDYGVAMGPGANAADVGDIAIGADAKVTSGALTGDGGQLGAVAVGSNARVSGASTTAFGAHSAASAEWSFAGGYESKAAGTGSIALGYSASTTADTFDAIAIGDHVSSSKNDAISIGSQITNAALNSVAMGSNGVSLDGASAQTVLFALNGGSVRNSAHAFVFNPYGNASTTNSNDSINLAGTVEASAGGVAIGQGSVVRGQSAVALGAGLIADDANTVSIGSATSSDAVTSAQLYATNQNVAGNTANIARLQSNFDTWTNDVDTDQAGLVRQDLVTRNLTVGAATDGARLDVAGSGGARVVAGVANGEVSATSTEAINAVTAPTYRVGGTTVHDVSAAIDHLDGRLTTDAANIAALQADVSAVAEVANNVVAYDSADRKSVRLGGASAEAPVRLTNLKDGDLSESSTDAVTGAQLFATNMALDAYTGTVRNYQQAGVDYVAVNSRNAPLPSATGADAIAVGAGAVAGGDASLALGANASASGVNAVALGANSVAKEDDTVSIGSSGGERRMTNVAPGRSGTDAVNLRQLDVLRSDFGASITSLQRAAFVGVAAAMAMPALTARESGKTVVAAGIGNYKGYSAFGAGATYRSRNGQWLVNGALSITPHGDTGMRAQVGYEF